MSITANFPAIRPTLNLDFVNSRTVDPRITFTRASTATYYDGKTFAKEEENLLVRSQEFDDAAWVKSSATVTANTGAAPDGTTTADMLTARAANGSALQTFTAKEQPYTFSLWVRRTIGTGTVAITADGTTWSAITISGTWTRFSVTVTPSAGSRTAGIRLATSGDAVEIWGAQLEQRSTVTAYTPTTDQPITRYVPRLMTAAANTPRIDFDPVTGACRGLLIEEQRTNLLTYSEQFDHAVWNGSTTSTIATNTQASPDGTLTLDTLAHTSSGVFGRSPVTITAGTTVSFSLYVKKGNTSFFRLRLANGADSVSAWFDLDSGSASSNSAGSGNVLFSASAISNVGNGWYRVSLTCTTTTITSVDVAMACAAITGGVSTTNDYAYIWGAQLEAGAFPTSYIPTTSSQVTRSADSAVMTGTNFSSWYRRDEGTIYFDGGIPSNYSAGFMVLYSINDTTANNNIQLAINAGGDVINVEMKVGGSVVAGFYPAHTSGTAKLAFAYKLNDVNFAMNGVSGTTDTSAAVPVVSQLNIGINQSVVDSLNGHIRRIAYWPVRLPNAVLQAITA